MPTAPEDPSLLDEIADEVEDEEEQDSVPLAVVKQKLAKSSPRTMSLRQNILESNPGARTSNLLGVETPSTRSPLESFSRSGSLSPKPRLVANQALLGIDFDTPVPTRPPVRGTTPVAATGPTNIATSRNDLKNSILSLYTPKPVPTAAPISSPPTIPIVTNNSPPGSVSSPPQSSATSFSALGDLSSLSLSPPSNSSSPPEISSAFNSLSISPSHKRTPSAPSNRPLTFGQIAPKPPAPVPAPVPASTFALPTIPSTTSKSVASTFNLSSALTSKPAPAKPHPQPQLLSSVTATGGSTAPVGVTSSYSNPWTTGNSGSTVSSSNVFGDPWSTEKILPTMTTTSAGGLGFGGLGNGSTTSGPTTGRFGFNSLSSTTTTATSGTGTGGVGFGFGGLSGGSTTSSSTAGEGFEFSGLSGGMSTTEKKEDDGFSGLFETANVWR
jgi:hypothetical protein